MTITDFCHKLKQQFLHQIKGLNNLRKDESLIIEWFFLCILFFIGLFLRFQYPVYKIMDDVGRDIYVAKNFFSDQNSSIFIRPNSTLYELPNTPFYFWLISVFYILTRSPMGILIIHSLMQACIPIFAYFSLKKIANKQAAIFISIFTTLSQTLTWYSIHIMQYSLLPFFVSLSFLISSYALKSKPISYKLVLLSILVFIPALLLHNSAIPIFIGFSFFWIYLSKYKRKYVITTILSLITITIVFILLSYQGNYQLLSSFIIKIFKFKTEVYSKSISDRLYEIVAYFSNDSLFFGLGVIIGTTGLISSLINRNFSKLKSLTIFIPILCLIISLLTPMHKFNSNYIVAPYYLLLLYFISFLIFTLPSKIHKILLLILITTIIFENRQQLAKHHAFKNPFREIEHSSSIVDSIFTQNNIQVLLPLSENYNLPQLTNWFGPSAIASSNKKIPLVDSHISASNIQFANSGPGLLICIDDKHDTFLSLNRCLNDFQNYSENPITLESIWNKDNEHTYYFYSFNHPNQ